MPFLNEGLKLGSLSVEFWDPKNNNNLFFVTGALKLDTEFISVSKIDTEKEEIPLSFLLLPMIMDFILVRFKLCLEFGETSIELVKISVQKNAANQNIHQKTPFIHTKTDTS